MENLKYSKNTQEDVTKAREYSMERSCLKCSHLKVCSILEYMQGLRQNYKVEDAPNRQPDNKTLPFKLEDMAKICHFYTSRSEISIVQDAQEFGQ